MHYIGLMSGTSADGVDAVVVTITPDDHLLLLAHHAEPIQPALAARIQALMQPGTDGLDSYGALDVELGELFAQAALAALEKTELGPTDIRAIGSHGQTVRHRPTGKHPFTLQIGNPSVIAERTRITTVADFRARDIAAGGQGAPLVPAFHQWRFHSDILDRAIVNIGGIANISSLPAHGPVSGFDTGPGNTLLDQWAQRHLGKRLDENGNWAAGGKVSPELLRHLTDDPYFVSAPPKSTGREYFNLPWLENAIAQIGGSLAPRDVQTTLVELTAITIADAILEHEPRVSEVYVCGGGCHNTMLMHRLEQQIAAVGIVLQTTEALGLSPDWVEACAFAWLAHRTLEGQTGNLPSVTGAKHDVVLGGIYRT